MDKVVRGFLMVVVRRKVGVSRFEKIRRLGLIAIEAALVTIFSVLGAARVYGQDIEEQLPLNEQA
jgi:hypothetical protein